MPGSVLGVCLACTKLWGSFPAKEGKKKRSRKREERGGKQKGGSRIGFRYMDRL